MQSSSSVAAAALPARQAQRSVDATVRIQMMAGELGPRLSRGALVYLSGSEQFDTLTERWQLYAPPKFIAVVVARSEQDVQLTVSLHRKSWLGNKAD